MAVILRENGRNVRRCTVHLIPGVSLIVAPDAERDIGEAQNWYDEQRPGLGAEFVDAVDSMLNSIRQEPLRYQRLWRTFRRARLRRFPYALIYAVSETEITVLACIHGRRDPKRWQERM